MQKTTSWVACAPGDPTESQWRAIRELASGSPHCVTHYNERTHWVRVEVDREPTLTDRRTDIYTVSPDGKDSHYVGTEV